jgi:hypothetical protein
MAKEMASMSVEHMELRSMSTEKNTKNKALALATATPLLIAILGVSNSAMANDATVAHQMKPVTVTTITQSDLRDMRAIDVKNEVAEQPPTQGVKCTFYSGGGTQCTLYSSSRSGGSAFGDQATTFDV